MLTCTFSSTLLSSDPLLPTYIIPTTDMGLSPPSFTNYFLPDASESPLPGGEVTPSSSPHYLILIAICCSILAAVVVGVVAYLVFKRSVGRAERDAAVLRLKTLAQLGFALQQQHDPGQRERAAMFWRQCQRLK